MVAEIYGGISAVKAAFDIAKGLKDIHDATLRNAAVIELQEKILSAQEAQATLIDRISDLEKEVANLKEWETTNGKYTLHNPSVGTSAFVLKSEAQLPEPGHLLCANCFERGFKSYLQTEMRFPGRTTTLACHECGSDIYVSGAPHPDHFKNRIFRRR